MRKNWLEHRGRCQFYDAEQDRDMDTDEDKRSLLDRAHAPFADLEGDPSSSQSAKLWRARSRGCIEAIFANKYAFESSRRDLHNALLCTALKSDCFLENC